MNFLLILPGMLDDFGHPIKLQRDFAPNLSLPYLAALIGGRHEVRIVNDGVEDVDFDGPADAVMITSMTSRAERAYQIADEFRRRGVRVIMGGIHATILPQEALEHVDAVVEGEAEGVIDELLDDLAAGALKPRYKSDKLSDLVGLPTPRYDLMNPRHYLMKADMVQAFRGCPNRCRYCSVHLVHGARIRRRPVEDVVRDIKSCSRFLLFTDDNLMADRAYARNLMEAMKPLGKHWGAQSDVSIAMDPELLGLARSAGCTALILGVESLSQATLATMNKRVNTRIDLGTALDRIRSFGIGVLPSMILGFEDDSAATAEQALEFLNEHQASVLYFFILTPLPGTALREELEKQGRLLDKPWRYYDCEHVTFKPANMTERELEELYWKTYERFYSFPSMARRLLWPPHVTPLVYNLLIRKNIRSRSHPVMGGQWNVPWAIDTMARLMENPWGRKLTAALDHAHLARKKTR